MAKTLKAHNDLRARHGAPPLQWSDECFQAAQVQANACQSLGVLSHGSQQWADAPEYTWCRRTPASPAEPSFLGQNAFFGSMPGADAPDVVQMWYDEVAKYSFLRPRFAPGTGHFTQVVWASSTHVGMARSADGRCVVASYFPAGNVRLPGLFEQNVLPAGAMAATAVSPSGSSPSQASPERSGLGRLGRLGRPFRRTEHTAPLLGEPASSREGKVLLGASGANAGTTVKVKTSGWTPQVTVKASGWAPEVLAALEGVPSPEARKAVQRGFAEGAAVTIVRQAQSISVTTEKAGTTRRWNMRWG
jgi:hypothetical protein